MKTPKIILKHRVLVGITLILTLIFGYFYFYNQLWTHIDPKTFEFITEYSGSRIRGHRGRQVLVHREFYDIVNKINQYAVNNNLHLLITQSYRPPNKKIYNAIVTPAVKSNHLAGHAVDFNIIYGNHVFESDEMFNDQFYKLPDAVKHFISDIQADPGIRWGGDFESQDPVHLDDAININDIKKWEQHYVQCFSDYINAQPKWRSWVKEIFVD
jgi:D-alanyl-D-alanine carboxypeptidase-like protein